MILWVAYGLFVLICSVTLLTLSKIGWHITDMETKWAMWLDAYLKAIVIPILLTPFLWKFLSVKTNKKQETKSSTIGESGLLEKKVKESMEFFRTLNLDNRTKQILILMFAFFVLVIISYYIMSPYQRCLDTGMHRSWCIRNTNW